MSVLTMIKGIFVKSSKENWVCDYQENFDLGESKIGETFSAVKKHNAAKWDEFMKGDWPVIMSEKGDTFARFSVHTDEKGEIVSEGIWTRSKKLFDKGKMEFKVRFNNGNGTWPAVWLRNMSCQDPEHWMDNYYEIDVVEYFGTKLYSNQTFHTEASMKGKKNPVKSFSLIKKNDWNIFETEWDENSVKIYVNGSLVLEAKPDKGEKFPEKYYLILSAQYDFGGSKWDKSELPKWMDVQYVKHYIKK